MDIVVYISLCDLANNLDLQCNKEVSKCTDIFNVCRKYVTWDLP